MATANEGAARITAMGEKIDKIGNETRGLLTEIQRLLELLNNVPTGDLPQEVLDAISAVEAKVDTVDALVPDAPAPDPVP